MDFYSHVFYTIDPRPELADWFRGQTKPELVSHLLKPVTYHAQEKDDAAWTEADRLLKAKLLFLHGLRERWCPALSEMIDYRAAFGWTQLREAQFDLWWTIQRRQASAARVRERCPFSVGSLLVA